MSQKEQERLSRIVSGVRERVEPLIRFGLEKYGFVRVENREEAQDVRLRVQRAFWALSGQDYLLDLPPLPTRLSGSFPRCQGVSTSKVEREVYGDIGAVPQRLLEFKWAIDDGSWKNLPDRQERKVLESIMAVPARRELFATTVGEAFSFNLPHEMIFSARRRLENMLEVISTTREKPKEGKRAIILTQTAYLLGGEGKKQFPYGFNSWFDFGVTLAGGTLPYLGAAVVYAELMGTGKFGEIEISDFRDEETISRITSDPKKYDLVLVSGATTFDTFYIRDLNQRLSKSGLTVINGGIAGTLAMNPERYLEDGSSLFIGEFEGAAETILERLENDKNPTIFVRGERNAKGRRLERKGTKVTFLPHLPEKVDTGEAYSPERERKGYLRDRLEALAIMRPMARLSGVDYEVPPTFRPHETNASFGCPYTCVFCGTAPHQGREMRARSVESIVQEWKAVETRIIAIVDQNLTANGRRYFESLLKAAIRLRKRVAFEGELAFFKPDHGSADIDKYYFDGSEGDLERGKLLKEGVTALAVGLEQPVKVKGTTEEGKNPNDFGSAIGKLNELGILTFGTAMIGLPPELWDEGSLEKGDLSIIPYSSLTINEWKRMLDKWIDWFENKVPVPGPVPFAFTVVPGTAAYDILLAKGMLRFTGDGAIQRKERQDDLFVSLNPDLISGIDSRRAIEDLRRRLYSTRSTIKRLRATRLSPKKMAFGLLFNLAAGIVIRDEMH